MQAVRRTSKATIPSNSKAGLIDNREGELEGGCWPAGVIIRSGNCLQGRGSVSYGIPMGSGSGATRTAILDSPGPTIWLKLSNGTCTRIDPLVGTASKRTMPAWLV